MQFIKKVAGNWIDNNSNYILSVISDVYMYQVCLCIYRLIEDQTKIENMNEKGLQ